MQNQMWCFRDALSAGSQIFSAWFQSMFEKYPFRPVLHREGLEKRVSNLGSRLREQLCLSDQSVLVSRNFQQPKGGGGQKVHARKPFLFWEVGKEAKKRWLDWGLDKKGVERGMTESVRENFLWGRKRWSSFCMNFSSWPESSRLAFARHLRNWLLGHMEC